MVSSRYSVLFEPVKIGPVTAPNRFYAAPHSTGHGWTEPNGAIALRAMKAEGCLLYTSPSPRDVEESRMPSSA